MAGDAIVARARALIGTRFRFQGRDSAGLDCVGLVGRAYDADDLPADYGWRGSADRWIALLDARLARCPPPPAVGDVLLLQAGPGQLHLGIWSGSGLIHAHAGLRRVVETPGPPAWPLLGCWTMRKDAPWPPLS